MKNIIFLLLLCSYTLSFSQNLIYGVGDVRTISTENRLLFSLDVETCEFEILRTFNLYEGYLSDSLNAIGIEDVAMNKFNEIFIIWSGFFSYHIMKYDTATDTFTTSPIPFLMNGATCNRNGDVIVGGFEYGKFSRTTNIFSSYGDGDPWTYTTGDLMYFEDSLYKISLNDFYQMNEVDPLQEILVEEYSNYSGPSGLSHINGAATIVDGCGHSNIYFATEDKLYKTTSTLDTFELICTFPDSFIVRGLASNREFKSLACVPALSLDSNQSSGALFGGYAGGTKCAASSIFLSDIDVDVSLVGEPDSMKVWFESGRFDGAAEQLDVGNVTGFNTHLTNDTLVFIPSGSSSQALFIDAIKSIEYKNSALLLTEGSREIGFILFAHGNSSNLSISSFDLKQSLDAGEGIGISVCQNGEVIDLNDSLSVHADLGGIWAGGSAVFMPSEYSNEVVDILYVVSSMDCPNDTAVFLIEVFEPFLVDLGPDKHLCLGDTLKLDLTSNNFQNITWANGSSASMYDIFEAGEYSVIVEDMRGCFSADTLEIELAIPIFEENEIILCKGKSYMQNGINYTNDTLLCYNGSTVFGCDSTDCVDLSFYKINRFLDTIVCAGEPISFYGRDFVGAGAWTFEVDSAGCLLDLEVKIGEYSPEISVLEREICDGETYVFGGNLLMEEGIFQDTTTSIFGCDSITVLDLLVLESEKINNLNFDIGQGSVLDVGFLSTLSGSTWEWEPEKGLSCSDCPNPVFSGDFDQTYSVFVASATGCVDSALVKVSISNVISFDSSNIYLPNVFTPRRGDNNLFGPLASSARIPDFHRFEIFRKNGEKVFGIEKEGSAPVDFNWNGKINGVDCPQDLYMYKLTLEGGEAIFGDVFLLE